MSGHQQSAGFEITKIAGENIPGGAAVIIDVTGRAYLFDPSNDNHYSKSVGIARHSAMEDHSIDICFAGEIVVAGSGWVAGTVYYVGAGGVLTPAIPAVGTPCMIGVGTAQDTILIKVSVPGSKANASAPGGTYTHNQMIPAAVWNVAHALGYYPNVTVVDSAGSQVVGDVQYTDINNLIITFSAGFSGKAYLS